MELSVGDRALLEFEELWPGHSDRKEAAIREAFDCSAARYYQRLLSLSRSEAAVAGFPVVVNRFVRESGRRRSLRAVARFS